MNAEVFGSPIFVRRATVIVQEIAGLADAIEFLDEWPEDRRDLIHQTALRACFDAHDGYKPIAAAHNAFLGFAKRAGILEDTSSAMRWIAACKSGSGKGGGVDRRSDAIGVERLRRACKAQANSPIGAEFEAAFR